MKLKCKLHDSRVMVLPSGRVVHRSNGEGCKTPLVVLGRAIIHPVHVTYFTNIH